MSQNKQSLNLNLNLHTIINPMFIDFNILAQKYPKLYQHLVILDYKTTINFRKHQSLIVLAEAIMSCIFGIVFCCPYNNLCPRIPSRLNYLLWVNQYAPIKIQKVLDIGTGATLIYPLLGYSVFKWNFIAIDTNKQSINHAQKLINLNKLNEYIEVFHTYEKQDIFDIEAHGKNTDEIDIVVCNPPFYDTNEQVEDDNQVGQIKKNKKQPIGQMLDQQFACEGGQYSFFFNMYKNSFNHTSPKFPQSKLCIKYFTCLIGRQTTFTQILKFLQYQLNYNVLQFVRVGEIRQGHNARFAVMWRPHSI